MTQALLVIADIGGYTRFMKVHRINLAHAQHIVARLLEAVIDGAGRKLMLAKLEGDAAFFYAEMPVKPEDQKRALVKDITSAVVKNFATDAESVTVQIIEAPKTDKAKGGILFSERAPAKK